MSNGSFLLTKSAKNESHAQKLDSVKWPTHNPYCDEDNGRMLFISCSSCCSAIFSSNLHKHEHKLSSLYEAVTVLTHFYLDKGVIYALSHDKGNILWASECWKIIKSRYTICDAIILIIENAIPSGPAAVLALLFNASIMFFLVKLNLIPRFLWNFSHIGCCWFGNRIKITAKLHI